MNTQNLIIYKFSSLYHILEEIGLDLNFNIISVDNENSLNEQVRNLNNYLIISNKKYLDISNQLILDNTPINFTLLIDKINTNLLKQRFSFQSNINIKDYSLNLNSRIISNKKNELKLTEREIEIILFLKDKKKPQNINILQKEVWSYVGGLETHTVETHIYRLRKKISDKFNDNNFIVSLKEGYLI